MLGGQTSLSAENRLAHGTMIRCLRLDSDAAPFPLDGQIRISKPLCQRCLKARVDIAPQAIICWEASWVRLLPMSLSTAVTICCRRLG